MYSKKLLIRGEPFCGTGLIIFYVFYVEHVCGYLNFLWLTIGLALNTINIIVFTRKNMISPNNLIFAHLAMVDVVSIIAYMPRSWHEFIRLQMYSVKEHRVYEWEIISFYSWHIAGSFHAFSIWLTIMLAVWRYIAVAYPLKERYWCDMKKTKISIIAGYIILPLTAIPGYYDFLVGPFDTLLDNDGYLTTNQTTGIRTTIFKIQAAKISKLILSLHTTAYGILFKILPSVVLIIFTYKLIAELLRAKKRREMLTSGVYGSNATNTNTKRPTDRTTKMILIILGLFFISEIPHGMCCILTAIYGSKFGLGCYMFLSEIFNTLTIIYKSVDFFNYYMMSQQFRNTFNQLLNCTASSTEKNVVNSPPNTDKPYDNSTRTSATTLNSNRSQSITTINSTQL